MFSRNLLIGFVFLAIGPSVNAEDMFAGLGDLSGGEVQSVATAVSAGGDVVVGSGNPLDYHEAVFWIGTADPIGIGFLPNTDSSTAYGVSADGSILVGIVSDYLGDYVEAFRWEESTGIVGLGDLPGGLVFSSALSISSDGNTIVGASESSRGYEAYIWTQEGGMIGLGDLNGGVVVSAAFGVNADGNVIVGYAESDLGLEAFRWTAAEGMKGLGDFVGGDFFSKANAVSGNGEVVVGMGSTELGREAFFWTEESGLVGLGHLPGGNSFSEAKDVNWNGSVIVGSSQTEDGYKAFRWLKGIGEGSGMRSVEALLADSGIDIGDWQLRSASSVSDDGAIIVGTGLNPDGRTEAWISRIETGLIGVDDFAGSFSNAANALHGAHWSVQKMLHSEVDIDKHVFKQSMGQTLPSRLVWKSLPQSPLALDGHGESESIETMLGGEEGSQMNLWGMASAAQYDDGLTEQDHLSGAFGLTRQATDDLRLGFGFHFGEHDLSMDGDEATNSDRESWGFNVSGAFAPNYSRLRLYTNIAALWFEDDIERSYLNGATPELSEGERDGLGYGASIIFGWEVPLSDSAGLMPFVSYDAIRVDLDAYVETGGSFPVEFDRIKETIRTSRVGAEVKANLSDTISIWSSVSWAHRFDDEGLSLSGYIPELDSDFAFGGHGVKEDWAELQIGVIARVSDRMRLTSVLDLSNDTDEDISFGGTIGFSLSL